MVPILSDPDRPTRHPGGEPPAIWEARRGARHVATPTAGTVPPGKAPVR